MTMAHTLSLEQYTAIANLDKIVKAQGELCGWNSNYTMDSIVRRYMDKTLADFYQDVGPLECESLELEAGIGTLLLTKDSATLTPLSWVKTEIIHMSPTELKVERLSTCETCSKYRDTKCSVAGCGCNGMGNISRLYSKCPMGLWKK
jgi:hypothetical protein